MKVFRIIPEFRILRLTFYRKSASKILNKGDYNRLSDLYMVCLKTTDHLNFKFLKISSGHIASFNVSVSKVQDFGNFELSLSINSFHCMLIAFANC